MLGWLSVLLAFLGRVYANWLALVSHRFLAANHWFWRSPIWQIDHRSGATIAAIPIGLYFLVEGTHAYNIVLGAVAGGTTFAALYLAFRLIWFSVDAAEDFLLYIDPYLAAVAGKCTGFLVTYLIVVGGYAAFFGWLYEKDPSAFSGGPVSGNSSGEFMFYSLTTITSVGLSAIHPETPIAKIATGSELLTGLILLVGVFGVFVAQLSDARTCPGQETRA
jgi:hypothetical protein